MCDKEEDSETPVLGGGSHYGEYDKGSIRKRNRRNCRFTTSPFFRRVLVRNAKFLTSIGKQMCPLQSRLRMISSLTLIRKANMPPQRSVRLVDKAEMTI